MATKYITYTFLCIIPFIILTAQGYIRLKGHLLRNIPPREVKVIAMAPDSDFCWLPQQTKSYSKNLLVLLPAFLLVAIAIIGVWLGSRTQPDVDSSQLSIALSIGAVLCVLPLFICSYQTTYLPKYKSRRHKYQHSLCIITLCFTANRR